jgi:diaminohydroxyphosphoribosylaminopyrimidine deaminase/5-amino-6-(5-phosphoribosylamino)uracil reductase
MRSSLPDDAVFMLEALRLARRGQGRVEPNPMVGCVLVRGGRIISRGWHRRFGGAHAEVEALRRAGRRARGATAYVSLEPCQIHAKTPPCTDALIEAGIARVVASVRDPNPLISGRGLAVLRRARVEVRCGVLEETGRELIAPFEKLCTRHLPWVIAKWAQSLDGRIATRRGRSQWLSSPDSRRLVHALRGRVDAVLVGSRTVRLDDPLLTCREAPLRRVAARVVLDTRLRTPPGARVVRTARDVPTWIFTRRESLAAPPARRLSAQGVRLEAVPLRRGRVSLRAVLARLARAGMSNVLIEGGGAVLGSAFDERLVDEICVFVCPKLIGGEAAPGAIGGRGPAELESALRLRALQIRRLGGDTLFQGRVQAW